MLPAFAEKDKRRVGWEMLRPVVTLAEDLTEEEGPRIGKGVGIKPSICQYV